MRDKTFLKISLAWSLIGIFLLILVAYYAKPVMINSAELDNYIGKSVIIPGEVGKTTYKEDVAFIDLKDRYGKVDVVLFDNPDYKVYYGDVVEIKGKVELYKGDTELIASEIYCVKCWN